MYQLTIATDEGVHTTCHAEPEQASRALLDYAIEADIYLLGDDRTEGQASSATDLTVVTLLRLDPPAGHQPVRGHRHDHCDGTRRPQPPTS